ncbi:hypothetical protein CF15_04520 [Pyrodictium occultum]|uniref:Gingipain domain-containing protein n=1 Tax=Pyrodictium occultum TaxID=2309 RepID=A0A0V8RVG9_PYROC|nr:C25 family cysteine peptidase [Pyrodictium occultum]KSW12049.1 hypothetical protein CF15_04520 [Pyrodictium occultum]
MRRLLPPALLILLLALLIHAHAGAATGGQQGRVVLTARVGGDGWAYIHAVLPPGSYRVAGVQGWEPRAANPRPLLLSFTPDPELWSRLSRLAVAAPAESLGPSVRLVQRPWGVELYAWVPGRPGSTVEVVLEEAGAGRQAAGGAASMIIVVPGEPAALEAAGEIARIHESQGLSVRIVTVDEIRSSYKPAPQPPGACRPGKNGPKYDMDLALRIVSMLREAAGKGARYVLIIGGARDVPPIYYCSPILRELVGPDEAAVPTDYYYADPNYDGLAELAVGRIPFTDRGMLQAYVEALRRWVEGGSWQGEAFLAGGAPFATDLMVGEAAVVKALEEASGLPLKPDVMMLSLGGYTGTGFASRLGDYGLYYLVTHGAGNALLDYVPGGLWNYDFEEKLRSDQVTAAGEPGVFVTPACRSAFWDYDLVDPPFKPPSLADALLGRGDAVAYLGYTRIAVEMVDGVSAGDRGVEVSLAGADAPLLLFLRSLGSANTLGDAWLQALNAYAVSPASHYRAYLTSGQEDIGELVLREAAFLGDPAAPNPWRSGGAGGEGEPPGLVPPRGSIRVGAALLAMPLARYASGSLPAFNPGGSTEVALGFQGACPDSIAANAVYRVEGVYLLGLRRLDASVKRSGGECVARIRLPLDSPGLVRIVAMWGGRATAYYLVAAGAWLDAGNGTLVLRGLDVLETVGDEPLLLTLNGTAATLLPGGSTSYTLPLAMLGPRARGAVAAVEPVHRYDAIYGGEFVESVEAKLARLFRVELPAGKLRPITTPFTARLAEASPAEKPSPLPHAGAGTALLAAALAAAAAAAAAARRRAGG